MQTPEKLAWIALFQYSNAKMSIPSYLNLSAIELKERARCANLRMENCDLCPRSCHVNRLAGKLGVCKTGLQARVSSYGPHLGEEDPLRGWKGSGTIFFSRCNLRCVFCQNHEISQTDAGLEVSAHGLAAIMLKLQAQGCHNINLVSPSHVVAQILEALVLAVQGGLHIPLVYNTGGYDAVQTLTLLEGIVDIYMPDMKYSNGGCARKYSSAQDYPSVNRAAVHEMYRQVGDLQTDGSGIAIRGLIVRHLVLPRNLAGTKQIVAFLANEISQNTSLNLMAQYFPAYKAGIYPELNRPITPVEYAAALKMAIEAGMTNLL